MKKCKHLSWSLGSYLVAFLLLLCGIYFPKPHVAIVNISPLISGIALILVLYGVFSSFKSIKSKESEWGGYVLILVGFVMLYFLLPVIANFLLAFTPV